jgi:hypothetical protein
MHFIRLLANISCGIKTVKNIRNNKKMLPHKAKKYFVHICFFAYTHSKKEKQLTQKNSEAIFLG